MTNYGPLMFYAMMGAFALIFGFWGFYSIRHAQQLN